MAFDAANYEIDPLTLTTPRARLEYMRDFLRGLPAAKFDMAACGQAGDALKGFCGSAACVGGWARAKFGIRAGLHEVGARAFGLASQDAHALFFPVADMADGAWAFRATPADAAQVLDHLLNTGEVDWSVARKVEA